MIVLSTDQDRKDKDKTRMKKPHTHHTSPEYKGGKDAHKRYWYQYNLNKDNCITKRVRRRRRSLDTVRSGG